ncbi:hypothetical protein ANN_15137 [Periplaneta americana]|uniref:Uncharacterized protein n=1 Tax=Periplaneta americana TaxID=6978 RepID=A0ABQ8SYW2_PERAM|nr:hypothetical protein ANN_15137 [Periplaneta americana]
MVGLCEGGNGPPGSLKANNAAPSAPGGALRRSGGGHCDMLRLYFAVSQDYCKQIPLVTHGFQVVSELEHPCNDPTVTSVYC